MSDVRKLLSLRYAQEKPEFSIPSLPALEQLLAHRSVRGFLTTPLDPETVPTLVAAAQSAASSSNLQPWSVVSVEDPARKSRLAKLSGNQAHIEQAPLFLVWLADLSRLRRVATSRGIEPGALSSLDLFLIAAVDAALAAQNAVVAAEALGLGTVYIGGVRRDPEAVARELELPPEVFPLVGLSVGRPDPSRPTAIKPRLSQQAVLHRETYSITQEKDAVEVYDRQLEGFFHDQGLAHSTWSQQASERVKSIDKNRADLNAAIRNLGFGLS